MNKMSIKLLCLVLLCSVRGPEKLPWGDMRRDLASRQTARMDLERELRHEGIKFQGIWDLTDDNSLKGMLGHGALWSKAYTEGSYDCIFANAIKINSTIFNKDGKLLQNGIISDPFTFNTPDDIRNLAERLFNGKVLSKAYLVFFRLTCGYLRHIAHEDCNRWGIKGVYVYLLCLDPRGFFFSYSQDTSINKGCPIGSYWTRNKDFYQAAITRASIEREEILESLQASVKALQDERAQPQTQYGETHDSFKSEVQATLQSIRDEAAKSQTDLWDTVYAEIRSAHEEIAKLREELSTIRSSEAVRNAEETARRDAETTLREEEMNKGIEEMGNAIGDLHLMMQNLQQENLSQQELIQQLLSSRDKTLPTVRSSSRGSSSRSNGIDIHSKEVRDSLEWRNGEFQPPAGPMLDAWKSYKASPLGAGKKFGLVNQRGR